MIFFHLVRQNESIFDAEYIEVRPGGGRGGLV